MLYTLPVASFIAVGLPLLGVVVAGEGKKNHWPVRCFLLDNNEQWACPILSYSTLSCSLQSYPILSYPALSCPYLLAETMKTVDPKEVADSGACANQTSFMIDWNIVSKYTQFTDIVINAYFCSFEWKNGTCNIYNGTVCLDYLGNSTMNKEIFFDIKYGVNGTERILKQFIDLSHLFIKNPEICR